MRNLFENKPWLASFILSILIAATVAAIFGFCCLVITITNVHPIVVLAIMFIITLTIAIRNILK